MAVYRVGIRKENSLFNIGSWENTYHVQASSAADALDQATTIMVLEQNIFSSTTQFDRLTAVLPGAPGEGGRQDVVGILGLRVALGTIIPPWNVCRVDWRPALTSRLLRKYLRIGLGEDDIDGQLLEVAITNILQTFADDIVDNTDVCTPSGGLLATGGTSVYGYIQMRQTDWSRAHRPGYHRGWVPD